MDDRHYEHPPVVPVGYGAGFEMIPPSWPRPIAQRGQCSRGRSRTVRSRRMARGGRRWRRPRMLSGSPGEEGWSQASPTQEICSRAVCPSVRATCAREDRISQGRAKLTGPDLSRAVELSTIPDETMLLGHARGEPVLLVRRGDEIFAIGAICTHSGALLDQGLLVGDTVRCLWHHACFSVRTGEALRAPALDPVSRWDVEYVRDLARQFTPHETPVRAVYVREKLERASPPPEPMAAGAPESVLSSVVARPATPLRKRFAERATPAVSPC
jgi:nitrite reductase/ring-hydroxylating ferredoxin subunit